MKQLTILDLDRTAFATDQFIDDIAELLEAKFHLASGLLKEQMPEFKAGGEMGYDFFTHAKWLTGQEADSIRQLVMDELVTRQYLFDDVTPWLNRRPKTEEVIIVTVGHLDFQSLKLACAPALARLRHHIVNEDKGKLLAQQLQATNHGYRTGWTEGDYETVTMIDDNVMTFEALGPDSPVRQIRVARPGQRYSNVVGPTHPRQVTGLQELA